MVGILGEQRRRRNCQERVNGEGLKGGIWMRREMTWRVRRWNHGKCAEATIDGEAERRYLPGPNRDVS